MNNDIIWTMNLTSLNGTDYDFNLVLITDVQWKRTKGDTRDLLKDQGLVILLQTTTAAMFAFIHPLSPVLAEKLSWKENSIITT